MVHSAEAFLCTWASLLCLWRLACSLLDTRDLLGSAPLFMHLVPSSCRGSTSSFRHQGDEREQGLPSKASKSSPGNKSMDTDIMGLWGACQDWR